MLTAEMLADLGVRMNLETSLRPALFYLKRPLRLFQTYERAGLRPDLVAGLTVAVILLPQAIAFALIAELPPQMGLYAAVVAAVVGGLWGSSNHVHTGPTNAVSLLVLSSLMSTAVPGTATFVVAAGLLAVMVGVFQLAVGLARLGVLVNFVSHSVIVGFASGAGVLIAVKQLLPLLGLSFSNHHLMDIGRGIISHFGDIHAPTAAIGVGAILLLSVSPRLAPRLPAALLTMIMASAVVFLFSLDEAGVAVIGQLPRSLPPLAALPLLDLDLIATLSAGALAVGAIGLVETTAISRSVATQTGQRLDSNQEFVGQGLSNLAAGFFSGYPGSGSFSRTAVNFKAGARTPMAAIFSGLFVLVAVFLLAPLAAYLPRAALAGVLIVTAYGLIDRAEIKRIWRGAHGDAAIMVVTFLGTLFLHIEFAVLAGILLSFALYIMRTSAPRVTTVLPDENFRHFIYRPDKEPCPQLNLIDVWGDLYFGAVNYVEEAILAHAEQHPEQRFLLIRMHHVNLCDFSGIHMLENVVRTYRDRGGDVFFVRVCGPVRDIMRSTGFSHHLGEDHYLSDDEAIGYLFHRVLDPAVCIYECPVRAFKECQNLPKYIDVANIPLQEEVVDHAVEEILPGQLWQQLRLGNGARPPLVVDVREPREFRQGHIPEAQLIPLSSLLQQAVHLPQDRQIVLVCRSGRRSHRAACALQRLGRQEVAVLQGGMLAWEAASLLEAVD